MIRGRQASPRSPLPQLAEDVAALQARATAADLRLVLVAVAVSNATDVVERYGLDGLDELCGELARRTHDRPGAVLHCSPYGGLLTGLLLPPDDTEAQTSAVSRRLRDFIGVQGDRVWPVVTIAARACGPTDLAAAALSEVRTTLLHLDQRAPGTTRWCDDGPPQVRRDRLALVGDLASALRHDPDQLQLAFQPVVDLATGEVTGAEALLRWEHPEHGAIPALDAVETAERSGLIHELGHLVLERSLAQAALWRPLAAAAGTPFTMHVNVSPHQLRDPGFASDVVARLAAHRVPRSAVLLELTESDLITGDAWISRSLSALEGLGVRLGIDDFGTGYSALAQLAQLPVDTVKVDRSLVHGIGSSGQAFDLLRGVLSVLATSDVHVVAEGVESAVHVAHLRALGCRTAQGYHLGRPVPADEFPLSPAAVTFAS